MILIYIYENLFNGPVLNIHYWKHETHLDVTQE